MKIELPHRFGYGEHQSKMTEFVRELTDCKHIGFYLANSKYFKQKLKSICTGLSIEKSTALIKESRANDFFSMANIGYDMYFYMLAHTHNIEDEEFTITDEMSTKKIAKVFIEAQAGKRRNRSLVAKFAQELAT
jgi:hypothetical protein